jgi:hypothetical protein
VVEVEHVGAGLAFVEVDEHELVDEALVDDGVRVGHADRPGADEDDLVVDVFHGPILPVRRAHATRSIS